jgi:hypothetical protein
MPEFAVDENDHLSCGEYKIGTDSQGTGSRTDPHDLTAPPTRDPAGSKDADHREFGCPVARGPDERHHL